MRSKTFVSKSFAFGFAAAMMSCPVFAFAQGQLNPIGGNGNILNPGVPLTGRSPVVLGPHYGSVPVGTIPVPGLSVQMGSGFHGPANHIPNSGNRGGGRGRDGNRGGAFGIPVPVYGGGGYINGNGLPAPPPGEYDPIFGIYSQPSGDYYGGPAAPPPPPSFVINPNFQSDVAHPVVRDYTNVPLPPPGPLTGPSPNPQQGQVPQDYPQAPGDANADTRPMFLIAMKDHTIYPALAYWVDKGVLNYITLQGTPNQVSLSLVDRELSKRLNDERSMQFRLPPTN